MPDEHMVSALEQDGYAIVRGALGTDQLAVLRGSIAQLLSAHSPAGIRGLVSKVPNVRVLSESKAVRALIEPVLGAGARLIRSVLFNKSQETNWQVAWHQDLAIAVQCQTEVTGFVSWSPPSMREVAHSLPQVDVPGEGRSMSSMEKAVSHAMAASLTLPTFTATMNIDTAKLTMGMFGITHFTAIPTPGIAAILAIAANGPQGTPFTITADHRVSTPWVM